MQNVYGRSRKGVCAISDDDADDYENVIDNRKVPAIPEREKKGNKTTGKKEDLKLKHMDIPSYSIDKAEIITHGPRTVPSFQPPPIGLDFSSSAVNAAFRDQTVEQTSKKKCKWDWKKTILILCLVLMFLFLTLLTSIMFIYYSNISNQLTELKITVSDYQDSTKKDKEMWKEDLMKVNQTLVKEIAVLTSDVQSIKRDSVNEIAVLKSDVQSIKNVLGLCTNCPTGWTQLDSSCYFFSSSHRTWENSQTECNKMASTLPILNSKKDMDALRPLIGNKRFWIGLRKSNKNIWLWVDGTRPTYVNWNSGEPNNAAQREHCTEVISGGWNDLDCSNTIDYICTKPTTC